MAGDSKSAAKPKADIGALAEKLAKSFVRAEPDKPKVRQSVVEWNAKQMMEFGYEFTAETLNILVDYLKGYNLWVCGNVGVGKTFFFECMSKLKRARGFGPIVKLSMLETQGWTMDDARNWVFDNGGSDVLIDDVGTEPEMCSYGVRAELFPYLLEKRMQLTARRTHITSNLGPADILKRYDRRVSDRFVQMFKMEQMKAKKSRRQLRPWKTAENGGGVP